jgi:hypothetical protein
MKLWKRKVNVLKERDLNEIKNVCKILFIDDKVFPVVDILKNSGWHNTQRIKDVDSTDQIEIQEAHILFIDIQGVGKKLKFKDEGLGLIIALKEKYPTKRIIVYSAEDQGRIQAFHPGIDKADKRLSKNTDPYQFQSIVEIYAREAFSLFECIERIKKQIQIEMGYSVETERILKKLNEIYNQGDYSLPYISKVFNLRNAASVANIVQLFFTAGA